MEKQSKTSVLDGDSRKREDGVPADNPIQKMESNSKGKLALRDDPVKIERQRDEGFVKLH